jgi:UDP-N-acetylmuramoylalanine--D-glutamate ligase
MTAATDPRALWEQYRRDLFLVVGFTERTGRSVAEALEAHGVRYRISDLRCLDELRPVLSGLRVAERDVLCGPQGPEQLEGVRRIVLSPGVPRSIPLIVEAVRRGIEVAGDVDLLCGLVDPRKVVAITGTDGKTTTAALTAEILGAAGEVVLAGNTGVPVFSKYAEILACDWLVLEVSSFMLEGIRNLRPAISTVLNLAEDHVDRYASFEEYAQTKMAVARHGDASDLFVLNLDDPVVRAMAPSHVRVRTVSRFDPSADYTFAHGRFALRGAELIWDECLLRGVHNVHNVLMAAAIGCEAGMDPALVASVARRFRGLPHRFEAVGCYRGVQVIDDSKATTPHAVCAAVESVGRDVVLVAGGRDKMLDFRPLGRHAAAIKHLVCYGEAGERIRATLSVAGSEYAYGFADAVRLAARRCRDGDTLLLSPGCTSWDQFPDYEARGLAFRALAREALG